MNTQRWIREKSRESECFFFLSLIVYYRKKITIILQLLEINIYIQYAIFARGATWAPQTLLNFLAPHMQHLSECGASLKSGGDSKPSSSNLTAHFSLFENFTVNNRSTMALFSQRRARTNHEWIQICFVVIFPVIWNSLHWDGSASSGMVLTSCLSKCGAHSRGGPYSSNYGASKLKQPKRKC